MPNTQGKVIMKPFEIKEGHIYASRRWKGDRKVVEVKRHRGQDAVVHFVNQRTCKKGNTPLLQFSMIAEKNITNEIT
jgi:hypothetical protein